MIVLDDMEGYRKSLEVLSDADLHDLHRKVGVDIAMQERLQAEWEAAHPEDNPHVRQSGDARSQMARAVHHLLAERNAIMREFQRRAAAVGASGTEAVSIVNAYSEDDERPKAWFQNAIAQVVRERHWELAEVDATRREAMVARLGEILKRPISRESLRKTVAEMQSNIRPAKTNPEGSGSFPA